MYTKDKSIHITLRLNAKQFDFVKVRAEALGINPSEFLRLVLNAFMAGSKPDNKQVKGK